MPIFTVPTSARVATMPPREEGLSVSRLPPRAACRSLFGPIDHDELRGELKRQLKEIQARDCQRWNFDFQSGSPLGGIYNWEAQDGSEVPSFYRQPAPAAVRPESLKENGESKSPSRDKKSSRVKGAVSGGKKRTTNRIITDFFPKRKRSSVPKVPREECAAARSLLCKEQTPRKKIR